MKITIPKIITPVDMAGYAADLTGKTLQVWVNPTLEMLNLHTQILNSESPTKDSDLLKWYAVLWSQAGDVETHWSGDELHVIENEDPAFLAWLVASTWEVRKAHLDRKKKI